ncbi:Glyoxalase [Methylocella tundrae]|uniref:Glyoxalase n=1 Tax=Methylocella tundrae TaxID=227605 RepID=A0A8B6MA39_METTU|nr:VOC family protein [Methylocella tundrae]VTZ22709.1 Glyoxalase [Methylocella tundrae]VTZ51375.1 Glyoxalase [Methylocella tundrae]
MPDLYRPKGLSSAVTYVNPKAAYLWLETAFGFEPLMVILDAAENIAHSEMSYGESVVMIGSEWSADHKSPKSLGGVNTQSVHVQMARSENIDAHCDRAREAGAEILQEPDTQFYGDRTYRARDPEGHIWTFGVTVREMSPGEWDKASGLKTRARL